MTNYSEDLSLAPPAETFRLMEEMQTRESQPEIQETIEILELDPVTTAHLLRQVNSPIFALRQSVASLDRAATMLGFDAISNTVFVETFSPKPDSLSSSRARLAYAYLIQTSITASLIADGLAHHLKMEQPGAVRTGAIVHQLGRMALLSTQPEKYVPLWKESAGPGGLDVALPPGIGRELVTFRTDYMRHGEQIAKDWGLPRNLRDSIRHHGDPERADETDRVFVLAVSVSQYAARTMFESDDDLDRDQGTERIVQATAELANAFDIPRKQLENFLKDAKQPAYRKAISVDL